MSVAIVGIAAPAAILRPSAKLEGGLAPSPTAFDRSWDKRPPPAMPIQPTNNNAKPSNHGLSTRIEPRLEANSASGHLQPQDGRSTTSPLWVRLGPPTIFAARPL